MDFPSKQHCVRTLCGRTPCHCLECIDLTYHLFQLAMMQPTDTVLTRMYNQPTIRTPDGRHIGALYKNPLDCLWKTLKAEGPLGWYKG